MVSPSIVKMVETMIQQNGIFIASKTYCSYSRAAKELLFSEYGISKSVVKLLELDTMGEEGREIQAALVEISGQRTVPNIYINKEHVGGNSDLQELHRQGKLKSMLEKATA